MTDIAFEVT